ncbi:inositol monophosphatase [Streptomyces sp. AV19]|uniref:inositol monophosphatase family protein n=1 Tax=Streptomyces sp. AV19 TaxID=2793068 RepID=UPI0018FE5F7C|nr:inositol monophosphatase [Streptomyces sp. AV19]MBH1937741.1 inositol monophosphatase [Streptomyces sp. AV19]MDG4536409.1 inositol monophosphatase [Streptomyces sp. AV19]
MNDLLSAMTAAAQEAGRLLLESPRPAPGRTMDALRATFASVDDPAAALLRRRLDGLVPDARWAGELDTELPEKGAVWVIDAIDGAVQYLRGLPHWCVSLALVRDREPVAAVLHSPVLGETCTAARGAGAHRDGVPVVPAAEGELAAAIVATGQPPFPAPGSRAVTEAGRALSAVVPAVAAVRNLGPVSWQIADVAAGRLDGFWEYGRDDANLLAGALIAREAGATVTDLDGNPWRAGASGFLVAPPVLHGDLLEALTAGAATW